MTELMKKKPEEISMELIWHAGNSKSCAMEALTAANNGDYDTAEKKQKEAGEEMKTAHQIQTDMLHDFANGQEFNVDILMVHAQDHLNAAILTMDFVKQMVMMTKEIQDLKKTINAVQI